MISINDKLDSFRKIISDEITAENEEKIKELKEEADSEVKKYNDTIQKKIIEIKKDYENKLNLQKERILSQVQKEGESLLSDAENEIYADLQKSLLKKLKKSYQGEEGADFLKDQLLKNKSSISDQDLIYLSENNYSRDEKIVKELFPQNKTAVKKEIKIGGAIILSEDHSSQINCTMDYIVEENRSRINNDAKQFLKAGQAH
ncbi:hypothetical protein ACTQ46_01850 [Gallicola sp. Sow4_E12]|uniref:hypothetical protein n=1 Tax=Gallicola sp. Sow4_E12 TaxID=3438785 RepID=UPI003F91193F